MNLGGLVAGITVFTLIFFWVNDELSYDQFHEHKRVVYRVLGEMELEGGKLDLQASTCAPLADHLKDNFPEIQQSCRLRGVEFFLRYQDTGFYKKGIVADPSFFEIFTFPIAQGTLVEFENGTNKIIISQRLAQTYFGNENPIGKVFLIAGTDMQVAGVMTNVPNNSHLEFDYVIPFEFVKTIRMYSLEAWDFYFLNTYIKTDGSERHTLENKIKDVVNKHVPEARVHLKLQPLTDIHLRSTAVTSDIQGHGNIVYVYLFASIAFLILLIGAVNYSNLATAKSMTRSKEAGVRKVLGSTRFQLASYFFTESFFYCFTAFAVSSLFSWLLLPSFNELTGKQLVFDFFSPRIIWPLLGFNCLCALLGGLYPALALSAQSPVLVFKGMAKTGRKAVLLRRMLVVFQFSLSVGLMIGTLVVQQQLTYISQKDLGFNKEKVIAFTMVRKIRGNFAIIKNELLSLPAVKSVTANSDNISLNDSWTDELEWPGKKVDDKYIFFLLAVDPDFLETYQISTVEGRDLSSDIASDSAGLLLNEAAVSQMQLKDPVGTVIKYHNVPYTIIGVVKNFHFKSIHKKIEPLFLYIDPQYFYQISIRLNPGDLKEQIKAVEAVFKKYTPERPFDYTFVEDDIAKRYETENRIGKISGYFTVFAVFISCLGLLGIILFSTEQRAKELAVRKVLGASVAKLVLILSMEYVVMALAGFIIAAPLAYHFMQRWLSTFACRTALSGSVFLEAALFTLAVAWGTVAYRSFKAATENPVKSLRSE